VEEGGAGSNHWSIAALKFWWAHMVKALHLWWEESEGTSFSIVLCGPDSTFRKFFLLYYYSWPYLKERAIESPCGPCSFLSLLSPYFLWQ